MNIREFAKLCGVAHSTVSRVMNLPQEKSHASKKTYDMIRAKAAEAGFHVNYYAQALHSKNSNCYGFVAGGRMLMLTEPLLFGMSKILNLQRKTLAVYPCESSRKAEAEAFEKMASFNAAAVFYTPINQDIGSYSTSHIRKALDKLPDYPPVIAMYGGTDIGEFYQIGFNSREIGKQAAMRQLACGCRTFGIIVPSLYCSFINRETARAYRGTLLENGIPEEDVRSVFPTKEGLPAEEYAKLRGVDGIWCSHYIALLLCASPLLSQIGDSKKLHVDCACGMETELVFNGLQPFNAGGMSRNDFHSWFASIMVYKYSLEEIGAKAAEVAMRLSGPEAADVPKLTYATLTPFLFGRDNPKG